MTSRWARMDASEVKHELCECNTNLTRKGTTKGMFLIHRSFLASLQVIYRLLVTIDSCMNLARRTGHVTGLSRMPSRMLDLLKGHVGLHQVLKGRTSCWWLCVYSRSAYDSK